MSYTFLEDIPEFLENQRTSFLRILDTGLVKALEKINPIAPTSNCNYGLLFYPKDYVLVLPDSTTTEAFLQGKTYGCKIYVPTIIYEYPSRVSNVKGKLFKTPKKGILKNFKDDLSDDQKNTHDSGLWEGVQKRSSGPKEEPTFGRVTYPSESRLAYQSRNCETKAPRTTNVSGSLYSTSTTEKNSKGYVDCPVEASAVGIRHKSINSSRFGTKPLKKTKNKKWINETQNTNFVSQSTGFKTTFKNYNACYSTVVKLLKNKFLLKSKQKHCSLYDQKYSQHTFYVNNSTSIFYNTLSSDSGYTVPSSSAILSERRLLWTKEPHMFFQSLSEQMQNFKPNLRYILKNAASVKNLTRHTNLPVKSLFSLYNLPVLRKEGPSSLLTSSSLFFGRQYCLKKRNLIFQKAQKCLEKTLIDPISAESGQSTPNTENYPFTLKQIERLSLGCYYTLSQKFVKKYNSSWSITDSFSSQKLTRQTLPLAVKQPCFSERSQKVWGEVTESGKNICGQSNTYSNALLKKRVSRKEWVCIGVLPLMTPRGHFIINGSHRIIVSQMSRAPGLYYETGEKLEATIVPSKGAWLRISLKVSENGEIKTWVRITPQRKMPYNIFFETYKYLEVLKTQKSLGKIVKKAKVGATKGSSDRHSTSTIKKTKYANQLTSGSASCIVPVSTFGRQALGLAKQLQGAQHGVLSGSPVLSDDYRKDKSWTYREKVEAGNFNARAAFALAYRQSGRKNLLSLPYKQGRSFFGRHYIARQTRFLSLSYKSVNNKIKQFDKHYAVGLISGQINRTLLNMTSYTLGSLGRKKLNERLGTNEITGYITSKDIHLIKNKLLKLLHQGSTAVDDDIDHLENRRVRTCGELLQTEIDVGLTRLKKAIEKHLDAVLTQNATNISKSTTSARNSSKQSDPNRNILRQPSLRSSSGCQLVNKHPAETPKLDFNYYRKNVSPCFVPTTQKTSKSANFTLVAKEIYWPSAYGRVGVDLALIGVNKSSLSVTSKLSYNYLQHHFWRRLTGMQQKEQGQTIKRKGCLQYNNIAPYKTLFQKSEKNREKTRYINKTSKTQLVDISPSKIVGTKVFAGALREFFGSNPLSQYMDQTNPLAEITHKRRLSSLGPGGIDRASAGIAVRGIHPSHYGRICPIETPEGKNAGLVNSMTMWARINREGFLETPYLKVTRGSIMSHNKLIPQWQFISTKTESYGLNNTTPLHPVSAGVDNCITEKTTTQSFTATLQNQFFEQHNGVKPLLVSNWASNAGKSEADFKARQLKVFANTTTPSITPYSLENPKAIKIVAADLKISASSFLPDIPLPTRDGSDRSFGRNKRDTIDFFGVSPTQNISVATSLIPFLEHDDATRALMGSNMQRQAVPLLKPQSPLIRTGLEGKVVGESGHALQAACSGVVSKATRTFISIDVFRSKQTPPGLNATNYMDSGVPESAQILTSMGYQRPSRSFLSVGIKRGEELCTSNAYNLELTKGKHKLISQILFSQQNTNYSLPFSEIIKKSSVCSSIWKTNFLSVLQKGRTSWFRSKTSKSLKIIRHRQIHSLQPYIRSNQATICVQRPAVAEGYWVQKGDLVADCSASRNGVLALGQNLVVAYLPMEGFNFEDAIVVSDRLVQEELYTSIHVQRVEFDMDAYVKKYIPPKIKIKKHKSAYKTHQQDWITRHNPHLLKSEKQKLNSLGIIKVGSWVGPGDVLVSKVFPVERKIAPSRHLLLAVFQQKKTKTLDTDDTSLRVPKGIHGRVINVKILGNGTTRPVIVRRTAALDNQHLLQNLSNKTNEKITKKLRRHRQYKGLLQDLQINFAPNRTRTLAQTYSSSFRPCGQKTPEFSFVQKRPIDGANTFSGRQCVDGDLRKTNLVSDQRVGSTSPTKLWAYEARPSVVRPSSGKSLLMDEPQHQSYRRYYFQSPMWSLSGDRRYAQEKQVPEKLKSRDGTIGVLLRRKTVFKTNEQKAWALSWLKGLNFLKIFTYSRLFEGVAVHAFGQTQIMSWLSVVEPKGIRWAHSSSLPYSANFPFLPKIRKGKTVKTKSVYLGFDLAMQGVYPMGVKSWGCTTLSKVRRTRVRLGPKLAQTVPLWGKLGGGVLLERQAGFSADGFIVVPSESHSNIHSTQQQCEIVQPDITRYFRPTEANFLDYDLCVGAAFTMLVTHPTYYVPQKPTLGVGVSRNVLPNAGKSSNTLVLSFGKKSCCFYSSQEREHRVLPCMVNKSRAGQPSTYSLHNFAYCLAPETVEFKSIGSLKYNLQTVHSTASNRSHLSDVYRSSFELFNQPDHSTSLLDSRISDSSISQTNSNFINDKEKPNYEQQHTSQGTYATTVLSANRKGSLNKKELSSNTFSQNKGVEKSNLVGEYKVVQVRVYIAERKKLQVGDKMSGRHGNKGIVSTILPREDMPYLPDGTSIDMVLNPLGIPSRMNVGQVFECLLGLAASICGEMIGHTPFDEMYGPEASRSLVYLFLYVARLRARADWLFQPNFPGKTVLFDGRTGIPFEQRVTVGRAYMLKLVHMVDDKIHARSIGPRSLVTQQPIKGRARGGGQRLGEMELWAFEGFGAAYTLQEILTLKSDDIKGREEVESSIISARSAVSHLPETFKMMLFELKGLCLNVELNQNF